MPELPTHVVVDTNVLLAADGTIHLDESQFACIEPAIAILQDIKSGKAKLVLDMQYELIREYGHRLDPKKERGMGGTFLKWIYDHITNSQRVDLVSITPRDDSFEEFPSHEELCEFDPSDRKFVAVANAHEEKPSIVQATDSKWWGWEKALNEAGLTVVFVNEEYIRTTYEKKMGHCRPE